MVWTPVGREDGRRLSVSGGEQESCECPSGYADSKNDGENGALRGREKLKRAITLVRFLAAYRVYIGHPMSRQKVGGMVWTLSSTDVGKLLFSYQ